MGTIHPQAKESYFDYYTGDLPLVKPFLAGFDVTRAYRKHAGRAEVAAFYLKPETYMAELLGADRELLLVHAPFPQAQARSIQLHDQILSEERVRLDPVGSILVLESDK